MTLLVIQFCHYQLIKLFTFCTTVDVKTQTAFRETLVTFSRWVKKKSSQQLKLTLGRQAYSVWGGKVDLLCLGWKGRPTLSRVERQTYSVQGGKVGLLCLGWKGRSTLSRVERQALLYLGWKGRPNFWYLRYHAHVPNDVSDLITVPCESIRPP